MKVEIVNYDEREHGTFVKSYLSAYMNHGLIYDLKPDIKKLLSNKIISNLKCYVIKIARDAENPDKLLGFCIGVDSIVPKLNFIYVKKEYQRLGIGTQLLRNTIQLVINDVEVPCKTPNLNLFFKSLRLKPLVRYYNVLGQ